jgi:type I restriction enzyme M protein
MPVVKLFLQTLNFQPSSGQSNLWVKNYQNNYQIEIKIDETDFAKSTINWGDKIIVKRTTTSNFSQEETLVVLECVDRLLTKGYRPEDILLEDSWKLGHKGKGFLDICVKKDGQTFLMIECKTWGREYDKELTNLKKDGGQLFSYFQQDKSAQYLVLYTSRFLEKTPRQPSSATPQEGNFGIESKNDIVVIEQIYRETNNLKDLFDRWNKFTINNGIFEDWTKAYHVENRSLTKKDLKILTDDDSGYIFNQFASILRRHAVSDESNAFSKIFNLFLAKIYDEKKREDQELDFQWREGVDNEVDFMVRLIDLYSGGMEEFLKIEEVISLKKELFNYTDDEDLRQKRRQVLKFNNYFALKEIYNEDSFMSNFRVLKDVVLLLQQYKIRYPRKQRHLSDFFERLLTTGLKQKAGQFFTPPTVAKFIVKSVPLKTRILEKLSKGNIEDLLPNIIDYACGSGHFLTESMEEIQNVIDNLQPNSVSLYPEVEQDLEVWKSKKYNWARDYMYGIEKDERLVKVSKVGCYFYGDGLAQVIYGDGLDSFTQSKSFRFKLKKDQNNQTFKPSDNPRFDFVLANPPYSVDNFKLDLKNKNENDFELYKYLTDKSKEIEILFIERTKQLLSTNGIAALVLPSSILSNTGLYTKTREILLKHFKFVAIGEFGSNTFMATGTNTVILFLKKREDGDSLVSEIQTHIQKAFETKQDLTINGVEKLMSKYVNNSPLGNPQNPSDLDPLKGVSGYFQYLEKNFTKEEIENEKQKILYFALSYPQKMVLVKTGEKDEEKKFLGYYFSNRRGHEGIKPFVAGGTVDDCTYLYDENDLHNPKKASSYIQKAFAGDFNFEVDEELKKNISVVNLSDLIDFEAKKFEKTINTRSKKKLKIESKWEVVRLKEILTILENGNRPVGGITGISEGALSLGGEHIHPNNGKIDLSNPKFVPIEFFEQSTRGILKENDILICKDGALTGKIALLGNEVVGKKAMINEHLFLLRTENLVTQKYVFNWLYSSTGQEYIKFNITGQAQGGLNSTNLKQIPVPLPPLNIQTQIVTEIEKIEKNGQKAKTEIEKLQNQISELVANAGGEEVRLGEISEELFAGGDKPDNFSKIKTGELQIPIYANSVENKGLIGYSNIFRVEKPCVTISARGSIGFCVARDEKFFPIVRLVVLIPDLQKALPVYLEYKLNSIKIEQSGTSIPQLTVPMVEEIKIPLPQIKIQQKIVAQIQEIEQKIESLQTVLDSIKSQKEEVLKKYL